MPLLGHHTQNPNGDPAILAGIAALVQQGTPEALATLQTIAQGGVVPAGAFPYGGSGAYPNAIDFSLTQTSDDPKSRAAERAAATTAVSGDYAKLSQEYQAARSGHKDWTGGMAADILPAVVGAAGSLIGLPPALTSGATGALEAGMGVTNRSPLSGAALGAGEGMVVQGLGGASGILDKAKGVVANPVGAAGTLGPSLLNQVAGKPGAGGGGSTLGPGLLQTGLAIAGDIGAASQQGKANELRAQGLATLQPGANLKPDLSKVYANPGNPYYLKPGTVAPPPSQSALQAARTALQGY